MKVQVVGLSHHNASISVRERLAFNEAQARAALDALSEQSGGIEVVLLSTCNRVELYTAAETAQVPTPSEIADFLGRFHEVPADEVASHLYTFCDHEAVLHLFSVASSLDSMVVGEPQILSQVKQAYQWATEQKSTGPITHAAFQAALKVARRVAGETTIHQRRVSIPSVAVADFAQQIFERFDDKNTLVLGAGDMAAETLRYLQAEGARDITVVNRSPARAEQLARSWHGRAVAWEQLEEALVQADLVISTTGAEEPVVTLTDFSRVEAARDRGPLFILDLAVPRDFDPGIADRPGVYLYSIDDLRQACDRNRLAREKEFPAARRIVEHESRRFLGDLHHRATSPVIRRLRKGWEKPKEEELERLLHKLPNLNVQEQAEIRQAFDRLVNKLMHPPLESLRDASRHGMPGALLEALSKLFQLKD